MKIEVCCGKSCKEKFGDYIITRVEGDIKKYGLKNIIVEKSVCMGMCKKGPNVKIDGEAINYANGGKIAEKYKGQIYNKKNLLKNINNTK